MEAGRRDVKIKPFIAALKLTKVVLYMEGAWYLVVLYMEGAWYLVVLYMEGACYSSNREPLWSIVRLLVL